jgi:TRAP-type C4-dicarboxylate transport system substrate-binding protein
MAAWVDGKDVATDIGNAMYKRILHKEFEAVKVVELNGCIQAFLWTKKPVKSLDDVKGMKVRSPGGQQTNYIKAIGAEPIFMPLGDVYMAMETGTIDGIVTCVPLILSFKLHEVAKHAVVATFGCVSEGVVMNKQSWNKIPDKKVDLFELPSQEAEKWYERFQDVTRTWVKDLEAKNLPAKDVVKMYNEECEKRGVKVVAFPKEWK